MSCLDFELDSLKSSPDDAHLYAKIMTSIRQIEEALTTWPLSDTGVAFNGGKDSIVLLTLVQYVLKVRFCQLHKNNHGQEGSKIPRSAPDDHTEEEEEVGCPSQVVAKSAGSPRSHLPFSAARPTSRRGNECPPPFIRTIFFLDQNNFEKVLDFMWDVAMMEKLDVVVIRKSFRAGLQRLDASSSKSSSPGSSEDNYSHLQRPLKAVFMGTRRSDPDGKELSTFSWTDKGWPKIMRVNPLLDWEYGDIWDFTRKAKLPYCSLYSTGYTSIGSIETTRPNRHLWQQEEQRYLPAWCLHDNALERAGRIERR